MPRALRRLRRDRARPARLGHVELGELAQREERFTLLKVEGSTSKAQNVNAALRIVTGEFTGVFDADHLPAPDAYRRAWRW